MKSNKKQSMDDKLFISTLLERQEFLREQMFTNNRLLSLLKLHDHKKDKKTDKKKKKKSTKKTKKK